jgi:putative transposase
MNLVFSEICLKKGFCMKRKRFAVEQIVAVLKEAEAGMPVAASIRRISVTEQMFYRWQLPVNAAFDRPLSGVL